MLFVTTESFEVRKKTRMFLMLKTKTFDFMTETKSKLVIF